MAEAACDILVLVAPDRRADDGRRLIAVSRSGVRIERRVCGVKMRIGVPIEAFRGIALRPRDHHGARLTVVTLTHHDPDLCVELEAARDTATMLMRQKHWAACLDTRLLAETGPRRAKNRRRGHLLRKRRPGILSRRKRGNVGRLATVFDATRELIAYD